MHLKSQQNSGAKCLQCVQTAENLRSCSWSRALQIDTFVSAFRNQIRPTQIHIKVSQFHLTWPMIPPPWPTYIWKSLKANWKWENPTSHRIICSVPKFRRIKWHLSYLNQNSPAFFPTQIFAISNTNSNLTPLEWNNYQPWISTSRTKHQNYY